MTRKYSRTKFATATVCLANGMRHRVHKSLLAGESDYFKALFKYHNEKEYFLHGIDGPIFGKLLDWMYKKRVDLSIRDALRLRDLADYLLISDASSFATETIQSRAHSGNLFSLRSLCTEARATDLLTYINNFIEANLPTISQSREFLHLPIKTLKATLSGLNLSPRVHEIWTAVQSWVLYDARNRSKFLSDLMVLARVSQLGTDFEKQVVPVLTKCKFTRQEVVATLQVLLGTKPASLDFESNSDESFVENLA